MEAPYPDHRCSLYLEAMINDVHVHKALVDTGSSINIISLSILVVAGVPPSQITKKETSIASFGNGAKTLSGYVQLDLKVGPIHSLTRFCVLNIDVNYRLLLGTP
ncbi:hypothetical protein L484_024749 [Morus notabilis]|uniref:Peptidase A2 domain-containing protein n=1 Tax=Morus notabilis TaxID=981085 RepID=W9RTB5_9ROSA|nr:hypothetical protein L484_024749 [Morus notabilis]